MTDHGELQIRASGQLAVLIYSKLTSPDGEVDPPDDDGPDALLVERGDLRRRLAAEQAEHVKTRTELAECRDALADARADVGDARREAAGRIQETNAAEAERDAAVEAAAGLAAEASRPWSILGAGRGAICYRPVADTGYSCNLPENHGGPCALVGSAELAGMTGLPEGIEPDGLGPIVAADKAERSRWGMDGGRLYHRGITADEAHAALEALAGRGLDPGAVARAIGALVAPLSRAPNEAIGPAGAADIAPDAPPRAEP